jgi:hypothetical protein
MKSKAFLTFVLSALFVTATVSAQSPSPSPSPTTIRDAVKAEVQEVINKTSKKAYVGTVTEKKDLNLTITNLRNQNRSAFIVTDATIKLSGGKDGTVADIKVGDFVIAMGDADGKGVLTIKRLLVIAKPNPDARQTKFVTVDKATTTAVTVGDTTYRITSTTKFTGKTTAADIKAGDKLIVIFTGTNLLLIHKLP